MLKKIIVLIAVLQLHIALAAPSKKKNNSQKQQNQTHHSDPKYNARLNALGLISGALNGAFEFKLGDNFAIGPSGFFYKQWIVSGYGLGVSATMSFSKPIHQSSMYLGLNAGYGQVGVNGYGTSLSFTTATAIVGYKWFFDGGFNVRVGGGLAYVYIDFSPLGSGFANQGVGGVGFGLDASIGYAF